MTRPLLVLFAASVLLLAIVVGMVSWWLLRYGAP